MAHLYLEAGKKDSNVFAPHYQKPPFFSLCRENTGLLDYLRHLGKSTSWEERRGGQASAVGAGEALFSPRDSSPSFPEHPEPREAVAVKITAGLPTGAGAGTAGEQGPVFLQQNTTGE